MRVTERETIYAIKNIRERNNVNWMRILEIALKHAPAETKKVLSSIRDNDLAISDLTGELAK